jgi:3',5'-cyclic AMP phosphodiesterase CpdA
VLVLGDTRNGYDIFGSLLMKGLTVASPDLILFTGDAVTLGPLQEEWDAYYDAAEPALSQVPMLTTHGNHETNSISYYALSVNPGDEETYSLDYGPFHLAVVNSSPEDSTTVLGSSRQVLLDDLGAAKAAGAPWLLAMHHYPPYSASTNHGSDLDIRAAWSPVYDQHHVDLVLTGHDHNYERSHPMFEELVKATPAEGTVYVVAGGAGASLYGNGNEFWTVTSASVQNYSVLTIRTGELTLTAYDEAGAQLDTFTITR